MSAPTPGFWLPNFSELYLQFEFYFTFFSLFIFFFIETDKTWFEKGWKHNLPLKLNKSSPNGCFNLCAFLEMDEINQKSPGMV